LEDLGRVHWALKLFGRVGGRSLLAQVEEILAEVVGLLEESLLSQVVLDILEVAVGHWELG
jgi:hypothetical protein